MTLTDADIEMMELAESAAMAHAGVCSLCEEALDPFHPQWADEVWPRVRLLDGTYRAGTVEDVAASVGPVCPDLPYHVACFEDRCG